MCSDDGDGAQAESTTFRRARKEHECCACREIIPAGDRYHETSGIWDGEPRRFRHCLRCRAICEALWHVAGLGWIDYSLDCGQKWEDAIGDLPEAVAALAFMTRAEAQAEPPSFPALGISP